MLNPITSAYNFTITRTHPLASINYLLTLTLTNQLHSQLVAQDIRQATAITEVDPFAAAVVEALGARDGAREPELLIGGLLVDDVAADIGDVDLDNAGLDERGRGEIRAMKESR